MRDFLEAVLAQLVALVTFFAFPALQYILLRRLSRKEGTPELWFLPAYGFRLVIRNIPGNKVLSNLKLRSILQSRVPSSTGSSVVTVVDDVLIEEEKLFLFPSSDEVIISFRLERKSTGALDFLLTDKLGKEKRRIPVSSFDKIICDYTANIENLLNFDIEIAKRAEIKSEKLYFIFEQDLSYERPFDIDRIWNVE